MTLRIRWVLVSMLFLGSIVAYLDRAALSIAAPFIVREMHLAPAQLGIVFSSFFAGYALFCFVGGHAADRFGAKRVFTTSFVVWSVFCGLTAAALNVTTLLLTRIGLGIGEGPFSATANKLVNEWFPHRERASAVGICNAGGPLGAALAGPLFGMLALSFGWRVAFVLISLIGFVWVAAWAALAADSPGKSRLVSAQEREEIGAGSPARNDADAPSLGSYLRKPSLLATAWAFFGFNYTIYFLISWFPMYLTMEYHMPLQRMAMINAIPWIGAFVGMAGGGFLSDFVFRLTGRAIFSRKLVSCTLLTLSGIGIVLSGELHSAMAATAIMSVATLSVYLTATSYWAIIGDSVAPARVGGVGGFVHFLSNCSGIVGPAVTGYLVQWSGHFESAFFLAGAISLSGALGLLVFVWPSAAEKQQARADARTRLAGL
ncbi:MFS transporter [Burkholderia sp. WAC0059]|uniref:MFS transporter n=1 Tax=Burkholderia sp. WAC0059 TaxID=2066022 RepID=UPI000C7F6C7E|nr:MFS transporter [Burkholderia sp. WAC0059]PLZ02193.1 MFS transporter [Burkholderia sp. WAC0059]